jgi:gluconolactonase
MTRTNTGNAVALATLLFAGCASAPPPAPATPPPAPAAATVAAGGAYPTLGSIERLDPALDDLIAPDAKIEKLAEGFTWAEGPLWTPDGALLFADVPNNVVHRWKEGEGLSDFLRPSGWTSATPRQGNIGANGMVYDGAGRLILAQHGDRRIARLEADKKLVTVVGTYEGHRFSSPNDVVVRSNGDIYFTDPPYGLLPAFEKEREIPYAGVYRLSTDGKVELLNKELKFPNGIAFSPDEKTLYVSDSDPDRAIWMAFDVTPSGGVANGRVFFDATAFFKIGKQGNADGLKVDEHGNLFATGPGGVLVFSPAGKHLGTIMPGDKTANVAWGDDGSTLYLTAHDKLCRIRLKTRGATRPH